MRIQSMRTQFGECPQYGKDERDVPFGDRLCTVTLVTRVTHNEMNEWLKAAASRDDVTISIQGDPKP